MSPAQNDLSSSSVGVAAATRAAADPSIQPQVNIFNEFALNDRVAIVSGGNGAIGLEMALALCEAGARAVYCLDLPPKPSEDWNNTKQFVDRLNNNSRLEYISLDVTKQDAVWATAQRIGDTEGRLDICIAAAGIAEEDVDFMDRSAEDFSKIINVNVNGVMYTAQAAARQMVRFNTPGSIILVGSITASVAIKGHRWSSYHTSKSAVLQMARSMAAEVGDRGIRVNTISPGYISTKLIATYLESKPELSDVWSSMNPLGRIGRPDELRGVTVWLASDASSFCTGSDILVSGGHTIW